MRIAALPAAEQVEEVRKEPETPQSRSPRQPRRTPTIEGGVVTGLFFVSDHVADISPVRALAGLKRPRCSLGPSPNLKSKVSDLLARSAA